MTDDVRTAAYFSGLDGTTLLGRIFRCEKRSELRFNFNASDRRRIRERKGTEKDGKGGKGGV